MPDFSYDVTTPVGKVRLLISDVDESNPFFTDSELSALLTLENNRVRAAAAQALDTMASNEAMVSKVIRTLDLAVDGTKVAAELRARAAVLREQDANFDDTGAPFALDVIDFTPDRWWWNCGSEGVEIGWWP